MRCVEEECLVFYRTKNGGKVAERDGRGGNIRGDCVERTK